MGHFFRVRKFRDESNESMIKSFKKGTLMEENLNSLTHISFNNGPEVLKKENRYTIRPKGLVRPYLKNCLFNRNVGYSPIE